MTATAHTATCTVFVRGYRCGAAAVYVEREFGECAKHAAEHGSMFKTRHMVSAGRRDASYDVKVGDEAEVSRCGKTYYGTVVHVGARGAAYVEFTYGNGATRRVRVDGMTVKVTK